MHLIRFFSLFFLLSMAPLSAQDQSFFNQEMQELMDWEYDKNQANYSLTRPRSEVNKKYAVNYYLIPAKALEVHILPGTSPSLLQSLQEKVDGELYYRWPINPEDRRYHKVVENYFKNLGTFPLKKKKQGEGRLSASRSCLACFEKGEEALFYKGSTDRTGGIWTDTKKVNGNQVRKALAATRLARKVKEKIHFKNLVTLDEPVGLILPEGKIENGRGMVINSPQQGIIFRTLGEYEGNHHHPLPGFTAIHETEGPRLALLNTEDPDRNNPAEYWRKHYAAPLGLAVAEFIATHGLIPSNPHSQQFLIDLDKDYRPTGKILFRDYNDSFALKPFFHEKTPENEKFLEEWLEEFIAEELPVAFGIFHGSGFPSWMKDEDLINWLRSFEISFNQRFSELTGVELNTLNGKDYRFMYNLDGTMSNLYFTKTFEKKDLEETQWKMWFGASECFRGEEKTSSGLSCEDVMDCYSGANILSRNGYLCGEIKHLVLKPHPVKIAELKPFSGPDCSITNEYFRKDQAPIDIKEEGFLGWMIKRIFSKK